MPLVYFFKLFVVLFLSLKNLGDLNYRLNDLTADEVKVYLNVKEGEKRKLEPLFKYDQLKQQQKLNKVFVDYSEV